MNEGSHHALVLDALSYHEWTRQIISHHAFGQMDAVSHLAYKLGEGSIPPYMWTRWSSFPSHICSRWLKFPIRHLDQTHRVSHHARGQDEQSFPYSCSLDDWNVISCIWDPLKSRPVMDLKGGNGPSFQRLLVPVMQIEYACDTWGSGCLTLCPSPS